ncbi:MAG: ribonuclease D [Rickettsiaceae bacterium]|nr:ribonuclease D [Rickettsiaceae bacterium]
MKVELFKNDLPDNFTLAGDIAIDTETMGLDTIRDRLCVIQISNGDGNAYLVQFCGNDYAAPNLKKLLLDPSRKKILHYARFDIAVILHYLKIEINNIFCTKIASRLTRTYTDYHGLKELCRELLGIVISKQQQSSNWSNEHLSDEQKEYAAKDVVYLHLIMDKLEQMLIASERRDLAYSMFNFLGVRAKLDLMGWNNIDLFAHH